MNKHPRDEGWPDIAGDPGALSKELPPPAELEEKITQSLRQRGLLAAGQAPAPRPVGWRVMRSSMAMAACAAVFVAGILLGRVSVDDSGVPGSALTGAETDLYALLLYETEDYDRASGAEARVRYGEYGRWVAEASKRGQFVAGEDLEIDRGWLLTPAPDGALTVEQTSVESDAILSGIFFIRAPDAEQALALARELPHLRHGGPVLVQKTIPTDKPPE